MVVYGEAFVCGEEGLASNISAMASRAAGKETFRFRRCS